jgi:uncharacterized protein HemX
MQNINARSRAQWMLLCVMGLGLSVSPCFAQENQNGSQAIQRLQEMRRAAEAEARLEALQKLRQEVRKRPPPLQCDSLVPEVCFEIYQRRMNLMKQTPLDGEWQR